MPWLAFSRLAYSAPSVNLQEQVFVAWSFFETQSESEMVSPSIDFAPSQSLSNLMFEWSTGLLSIDPSIKKQGISLSAKNSSKSATSATPGEKTPSISPIWLAGTN
jgi:hypothetical protein